MKKIIFATSALILIATSAGVGVAALASAAPGSQTQSTSASKTAKHHKLHLQVRLNQAVRDGTITESQKQSFISELKSLASERKTAINKSSTKAERKAERSKLKSELDSWAQSNNFPLAKIAPRLS